MPFARQPLVDLRRQTLADLAARVPGSDPFVRRSALNVLGTVLAGHLNLQYGYLDWESRMNVPFTAEGEYALGWGALKGKTLNAAAAATGSATIAGGTPGKPISSSLQYSRSDGALYTVTTGATIAGDGTATIALQAVLAGAAGNSDPGTPLTPTVPIDGVPNLATVVTMSGGAEVETIASLRSRYLQAFAAPPQGGDLFDYPQWAREVAGVTRAWTGGPTIMGAGTVTVYFMIDDGTHTNGLPIGSNGVSQFETRDVAAAGDQLIVADHLYTERPVTALVYAMTPVGDALNVTLAEVPVDATIRAGISAAIAGFLIREASPGGTQFLRRMADGTMTLVTGGTIDLSHLDDAIAAVPNLDHFVRTVPAADVTVATGHISIPGVVSYI